jgi:predicted Rossmann fold flavoprotein
MAPFTGYDICVIGGGAAGFFSAIQAAEYKPGQRIIILEKTEKLLSKVKISGGGRCNITQHCYDAELLATGYPRGAGFLLPLFRDFGAAETVRWFASHGVPIQAEKDGRMFPSSNSSQTIIDCFTRLVRKYRIEIMTRTGIEKMEKTAAGFLLSGRNKTIEARKIIVCSGGNPKEDGLSWIKNMGISTVSPCPSLFTFNMPGHPIGSLAGISVENTKISICGTDCFQKGPLLITHWGLSGPAVIRLSAWKARELNLCGYRFEISISWLGNAGKEEIAERLRQFAAENPKKQVKSISPFPSLPQRLWQFLVEESIGSAPRNWAECGKKNMEIFIRQLYEYRAKVSGKTTFKEEFVTCGGVALEGINPKTMESLALPGCFFAGEVLDIDGITGGYNFQAAWTTGRLAGISAAAV